VAAFILVGQAPSLEPIAYRVGSRRGKALIHLGAKNRRIGANASASLLLAASAKSGVVILPAISTLLPIS
jgi:hypothetical protein